jgi:glycosyltransferase involved in cell wall biosynthesis
VIIPEAPPALDRLIIHQFDVARPSPGGIDTCIRGILKYRSDAESIGVVGVDTGSGPSSRRIGVWERTDEFAKPVFFLPVARLDPADQSRRVPHSLRLIAGVNRYRGRIPTTSTVQAHRADTAAFASWRFDSPLHYFIHTQGDGLTGATSDSFWKRAASLHKRLEHHAIREAIKVAVFNPDYGAQLAQAVPYARAFPTWYDPDLLQPAEHRRPKSILWVGRVEVPKDPSLAIAVLRELLVEDPEWTLQIVGDGTLVDELKRSTADIASSITFAGRMAPNRVAEEMGRAAVFLMTSHAGYEGFPRVLVEAMASGAVPVTTQGSDTGRLIVSGVNGYTTDRNAKNIAQAVRAAPLLDRNRVTAAVASFSAPAVVAELYGAPRG